MINGAIIVFVLGAIAVCIARGSILDSLKYRLVRKMPKSIEEKVLDFLFCPMCLGFWIGLAGSILIDNLWIAQTGIPPFIGMPFVVSFCAMVMNRLAFGASNE